MAEYRVPTFGPGRVIVGHDSEMGYWFALFEHNDNRADAVSDPGQFVNVQDFIAKTAHFINWRGVPRHVIHSLSLEGDPREQEAARLIASSVPT